MSKKDKVKEPQTQTFFPAGYRFKKDGTLVVDGWTVRPEGYDPSRITWDFSLPLTNRNKRRPRK